MPINRLYRTWSARIEQMSLQLRITRRRNLDWLLAGICQSRSVHLHHIVEQIPGRATLVSLTRRLSRSMDSRAIRVRSL